MRDIKFDFNNMFSFNVGKEHGITEPELAHLSEIVQKCHHHFRNLLENPTNRVNLGLEWAVLPFQDKGTVQKIQELGEEISSKYESILFLGIGGSYLGLKAAQDALSSPYYNEFSGLRAKRARIYFEGNNLDPAPLGVLLNNLDPRKTFVVVISKSGETIETKATFDIVDEWLKKKAGKNYGRQILAITDPVSGSLRKRVENEQGKDILNFRNLPLFQGVGGRYSEFNMGLLHLAMIGVNIREVLAGAQDMARWCNTASIYKNPAYLYAALHFLAYQKKGKSIGLLMPFTELLKSTADWYSQLLAESLGKKYRRRIRVLDNGVEEWQPDTRQIVHTGRTPVSSRGTTDLHSLHQNNVEGENNKTVTMIRIERFKEDLHIPVANNGILSGKSFTELLKLAQEATEWALIRNNRPNCTIILSEITPWTWGSLIYFFEMATAFEGELLNVNAFDQPGVESYKNYMHYKLAKLGVSRAVAEEIQKHPVKHNPKYIL